MKNFPIVCVGGSAGGLDAYRRLLKNLPVDLGVAIVIVNHMTKTPTQLHEILPGYTSMPESAIASGRIDFILSPEDMGKNLKDIIRAQH